MPFNINPVRAKMQTGDKPEEEEGKDGTLCYLLSLFREE